MSARRAGIDRAPLTADGTGANLIRRTVQCSDRGGGVPATQHSEQPPTGPPAPLSELVLVDQHEAQGRRVRRDERLDHLFEERCDWNRRYGRAGRLAVDSDEMSLTYAELDARANRLARYLRLRGARAGDRIALLFDRPAQSYVAVLATLKIGAAYVPLDVATPTGRLAYIVEDARARTVLSMSHVADRVEQIDLLTANGAELVYVDRAAPLIEEMDPRRLIDAERGALDDQLAYISYSSASGRPEGVAIDHASICNFVKVAAEVYGIRSGDRVYQGLPIALDFSVEEIWVPWVCGATLVPRPPGPNLLGPDLHEFLRDRRVTALCCVPGVLETLPGDLPDLRFLLVCGKDCPRDLIARWHRPGRRFLSVYGPTEATVSAAWTELHPDRPPTIGVPLPTYSTVILDAEDPYRALPHGEVGEIGIAGIGLACGYLNHDDLTDEVFVQDFLGIPANPSGRIYRTGDLGRVTADREIEYHGRVDREAVTRELRIQPTGVGSRPPVPAVPPAPVAAGPAGPANDTEGALAEALAALVGREVPVGSNFFDDLGADSLVMAQFCARVRKRADLPPVSIKDVYRYPTVRSLAAALADTGSTPTERSLAEVLAGLMGCEVTVGSHFFDDLGADSLVMAQFCARVRKRVDLPPVSIKDVYAHPTMRGLATALAQADPGRAPGSPHPEPPETTPPVGTPRYVLCGALQALFILGYAFLTALIGVRGFEWISAAPGPAEVYLRSVLVTAGTFVGLSLLPIAAKWVVVGRWKPQRIRVWSLAYVRFWVVKALIRSNPMVMFVGSPLYVHYLRALGARIGRGAVVFSPTVPVCTDLLTIGADTVVSRASSFTGYAAVDGVIHTGAVTLGRDVFVGDATVLDIGTAMGDGSQLGHTSSLHPGQAVPAGEAWHGSPAQPTTADYRVVGSVEGGAVRRVGYSVLQLLNMLLLLPAVISVPVVLLERFPQLAAVTEAEPSGWALYLDAVVVSLVVFLGSALAGLLLAVTVARVLGPVLEPDRLYPLYGVHYWIQRVIARTTNSPFLTQLLGDSSFVVGFVRLLGYDLSRVQQTGSNFGSAVKHDVPALCAVGTGTVIADGLSFVNADFSNSSFRVSRVSIGAHNFLGNNIFYPSQGRTGDDCLLGTKVMVPVDGEVRTGVGLLGSPCFEIPRSVERDTRFDPLAQGDELRRRLAAKNRHNLVTMGLFLLVRWVHVLGITLIALAALDLYPSLGVAAIALFTVLTLLFTTGWFVLVGRAVSRLQAWAPNGCSIYDRAFWRHERFWKVPAVAYLQVFNGTPFKGGLWRLLGVRIGRRVFDDGVFIAEKTFVTIGDGATLNAGAVVQCHSQEDGAFKSDLTVIGAGVTLGVGAFVHYGVTMGDGAALAADSFLMKGEEVPAHERWGGNPAGAIRDDRRASSTVDGRRVPHAAA
ncbi:AMP-binding protein [Pseudonocardia broussonetiae]|uniref:AMP-binding protein n=1 Tax=Pseudonocardia broussonetiae TaxID=2736640 RepID=A0A6M6JSW0_9PSEU|nr:AMP-binding protein [Pseudonocardia broussonetiae]